MAKKKKTLPKNILDILENKDFEAFKSIWNECEWEAYERGDWMKKPLLCFYGIPAEFIRYMVENGADIEAKDTYGRSALWHHASVYNTENVAVLLELGADIHIADYQGDTPLHTAEHRLQNVKLLLEKGANPNAKNLKGETPLESMLNRLNNSQIEEATPVAELYLSSGLKVNKACQKAVQKIGEQFEFYRDRFNPEMLEQTVLALEKLYQLFGIEPVKPLIKHDGKSDITLPEGSWQSQFDALWEYLVPGSGKAATVQGELIRIAGKVNDEILRNGAVNWRADFKKMLIAWGEFLKSGEKPISEDKHAEIEQVINTLKTGDDDEEAQTKLMTFALQWIANNPKSIPLGDVNYRI